MLELKTGIRIAAAAILISAVSLQSDCLAQTSGDEIAAQDPPGPKAAALFGSKWWGSRQVPSPIGSYSLGCLAGGGELPETGPTWQAMRLSRNRNWGHHSTVAFVKELSEKVATFDGWKGLYVGDIGNPRGGPMMSDHRSHQVGLDVDIWLFPPDRLDLTVEERETLSAISVRSQDLRSVNDFWRPTHMDVLRTAAEDPRVDRIFITAPAKIWMCARAGDDRDWLQKIRPYWGHHYHFHVRLKCPADAPDCVTQKPSVAWLSNGGDGCDETLDWWITDALKPPDPDAPEPPKVRGPRDFVMAELPASCQAVLDAPGVGPGEVESLDPRRPPPRPWLRRSVEHTALHEPGL